MQFHNADTIVAIITPPGVGAIGVIRLSGARALEIADRIFRGKRTLNEQASHTAQYGRIVDARTDEAVDEVLVTLFRNPHSYTGEDTAEISGHGSRYILQRVLELCVDGGARPAGAGEFTQRAFLNGKLDLTQAEAVHDIIASESAAAHKAAMHQLRGGFSKDLRAMREELITFAALIELELDFSEEDVEFADRSKLRELLQQVNESTSQLIGSFRLGNAVKNGVSVAIIGAPNAGKSTLLNALLNEERAIVSDIPGTTRDTVEEVLNIDGILFRFIDTAGIRETTDQIEARGIERAKEKVAGADVVIHLYEDDHRLLNELQDSLQDKVVFNLVSKTDINQWPNDRYEHALQAEYPHYHHFGISVKTGFHLNLLRRKLVEAFSEDRSVENTIITNTRHLAALQEIQREVEAMEQGLAQGLSGDLLSHHIRAALFQIGQITGEVVQHDRDILGTIFGKFCIGK